MDTLYIGSSTVYWKWYLKAPNNLDFGGLSKNPFMNSKPQTLSKPAAGNLNLHNPAGDDEDARYVLNLETVFGVKLALSNTWQKI